MEKNPSVPWWSLHPVNCETPWGKGTVLVKMLTTRIAKLDRCLGGYIRRKQDRKSLMEYELNFENKIPMWEKPTETTLKC